MRKQHWIALAAVLLLVALLGRACGTDEPEQRSSGMTPAAPTTAEVGVEDEPILTGTVTESSGTYLYVDIDDDDRNRDRLIRLAHLTTRCSAQRDSLAGALLLLVGARVTLVRDELSTEAFVHQGDPQSTVSVNEQLVAEGSAAADSSPPSILAGPYVERIVAADRNAWDQRIGAAGVCRAEDEARQAESSSRTSDDSTSGGSNDDNGDDDRKSRFCRKRWWC